MDAFTIQIAGLAVGVQPLFISTREYFRAYLSEREPEILIEVFDSDLVYEQQMLDREALEEGLKFRQFTGPFLERAAIQRKVAVALLEHFDKNGFTRKKEEGRVLKDSGKQRPDRT